MKTKQPAAPLNVIVIDVDEYRSDLIGALGHPVVRTPNIDALASTGVLFENAFCVSPLCVPSRVSFFTGQYVNRTRSTFFGARDHIGLDRWSFIQELKERNYVIGQVGKNHAFLEEYFARYFDFREEYEHHGKVLGEITAEDKAVRDWLHDEKRPGFWHYDGRLMEGLIQGPMPFRREACPTWRIADDACRFLEQRKDEPFFLHIAFPDPHWPNVAPEPYYSMYPPESLEIECLDIDWSSRPFAHFVQSQSCGCDRYSLADRQRILATYLGQISFVDDAVGRLLEDVRRLGLRDRTLIVFTADHGAFAGRYGLPGKTKAFYDALLRIPLIISMPGVQPGRVQADVSNIDVMPTIADVLDLPVSPEVQGISLCPLIRGDCHRIRDAIYAEVGTPEEPPPPMPLEDFPAYNRMRQEKDGIFWFIEYVTRGRSAAIRADGWKYCFYTGDREELYDLRGDPMETKNLAGVKEHSEKQAELKDRLVQWLLREPMVSGR